MFARQFATDKGVSADAVRSDPDRPILNILQAHARAHARARATCGHACGHTLHTNTHARARARACAHRAAKPILHR